MIWLVSILSIRRVWIIEQVDEMKSIDIWRIAFDLKWMDHLRCHRGDTRVFNNHSNLRWSFSADHSASIERINWWFIWQINSIHLDNQRGIFFSGLNQHLLHWSPSGNNPSRTEREREDPFLFRQLCHFHSLCSQSRISIDQSDESSVSPRSLSRQLFFNAKEHHVEHLSRSEEFFIVIIDE